MKSLQGSLLVEKLTKHEERIWYAHRTIEHGWGHIVLEIMIKNFLRYTGTISRIGNMTRRRHEFESGNAGAQAGGSQIHRLTTLAKTDS
jgi:hypothetical protein